MAVGLVEILIQCWNLEYEQDFDRDILWKSSLIDIIYITVKSLYHWDCTWNFSDTNINCSMHIHVCKKHINKLQIIMATMPKLDFTNPDQATILLTIMYMKYIMSFEDQTYAPKGSIRNPLYCVIKRKYVFPKKIKVLVMCFKTFIKKLSWNHFIEPISLVVPNLKLVYAEI